MLFGAGQFVGPGFYSVFDHVIGFGFNTVLCDDEQEFENEVKWMLEHYYKQNHLDFDFSRLIVEREI